jgi:hypothetical protein
MRHDQVARPLALSLLLFVLPAWAGGFGPKEVQDQWVGKTLSGTTGNGRSFTLKFNADGTIEISGEAATDTGTWRLSDTGYCATWKKIRAGAERCFTMVPYGNGEVRVNNPDGSVSGYIAKVE